MAWYCGNLCSFQSNSSQCQEYISSAVNAKTRIFSRSQLLQRGHGEAAKTPIKLCQPLTFISKLHFSPCHQKYFYRSQKFGLSNVSIDHDFYLALFLLDRNRLLLPQSVWIYSISITFDPLSSNLCLVRSDFLNHLPCLFDCGCPQLAAGARTWQPPTAIDVVHLSRTSQSNLEYWVTITIEEMVPGF